MTTFEKVKKIIIEKLSVPEEKVTEDAAFINDLGADSLLWKLKKNLTSQFLMKKLLSQKKLAMLLNILMRIPNNWVQYLTMQ